MKKALRHVLLRLTLVLIVLPASDVFGATVQENCNAVRAASAKGRAAAAARVAAVAASANGSISSQRSCMESYGDSASRAIADLSGLDVSGVPSQLLETACQVIVKAVSDKTGGVVSPSGPVGANGASQALTVPRDAAEFYKMFNDPSNAGKMIPWPVDTSGLDAATRQQVDAWRASQNASATGSSPQTANIWDLAACKMMGNCN